jgi:hypothetical protein
MRPERFENHLELAGALHRLASCIRLLDAEDVEYLVPLKRLANVTPQSAFVVDSRHGACRPLASLAYPIRVQECAC